MAASVPPHNMEAERSVLGAILIDSNVISNIADILKPEHFYAPQHRLIYDAVMELYRGAKPIDVVTLTTVLKKKNKLNQVGGSAYLSELIAEVPTSAHVKEYAELVKESSIRRSLISLAGSIVEEAQQEAKKLEEVMDLVESNVFALSQDSTQADFFNTETLLEMYMKKVDDYSKNPDAIRGIPTGLRDLDQLLGGLHNSELIILAARPSVGKSSLAFDVARHAAVEESKAVAIFSLEMPAVQVTERLMSQQMKLDLWTMRMGRMNDSQFERWTEGAGKLVDANLFVDETPGVNIMQLRSKTRKLKMEHGLDLVVIDYLQLMQGMSSRPDNRVAEVSEISRSLKLLARELNIPILALAQLNRSVESRTDHRPQLSDLRDSGSIEQDADVVMFLNREKLYNPETERPDVIDVIVAKHRNGPVGQVELKFLEKTTSFADID